MCFYKKVQVASFINNMLVGTKSKEEYNKLVEKVLTRMKVNNLYIKPEKYK